MAVAVATQFISAYPIFSNNPADVNTALHEIDESANVVRVAVICVIAVQDIPALAVKVFPINTLVVALQKIDEMPEKITFAFDDIAAEHEIVADAIYVIDPVEFEIAEHEIDADPSNTCVESVENGTLENPCNPYIII